MTPTPLHKVSIASAGIVLRFSSWRRWMSTCPQNCRPAYGEEFGTACVFWKIT